MSFSIGSSALSSGPGAILEDLGSKDERGRVSGRVVVRLMGFLRPYGRQMLLATVLVLISTAANLLVPYLTKVAIDENIQCLVCVPLRELENYVLCHDLVFVLHL